MVFHNSARGDTFLVLEELTVASPRIVSLEQVLNLYEVLDNLHSSCSLTFLVLEELTVASPRIVSLEQVLNLYEVLDNLHSFCSLQPLPFLSTFYLND